jgi:hypothetical protein
VGFDVSLQHRVILKSGPAVRVGRGGTARVGFLGVPLSLFVFNMSLIALEMFQAKFGKYEHSLSGLKGTQFRRDT